MRSLFMSPGEEGCPREVKRLQRHERGGGGSERERARPA